MLGILKTWLRPISTVYLTILAIFMEKACKNIFKKTEKGIKYQSICVNICMF